MIKWEIAKKDLVERLDVVQKSLPLRTPLPALQNIYFEIENERLLLKTTNLDMGISAQIPFHKNGHFKALFPAKIVDLVRHLEGDTVVIEINDEDYKAKLMSGKSIVELFLTDSEDFPSFPVLEGLKIKLGQSQLKDILKKTIFCSSKEEGKQLFQGIFFTAREKELTALSSDTFRLALVTEPATVEVSGDDQEGYSFLCPAKNLNELYKILKDDEDLVTVYIQERKVIFDLGDKLFFSLLMDNRYPDLKGAIPEAAQTSITVAKHGLEQALNRALLLAESVNNLIKLSINEEKILIKSQSEIGRMEVEVEVDSFDGEKVDEIFFNGRFLLEPLKVVEKDKVLLSFHGPLGPCTVTVPEDETFFYLTLPVKTERE